MGHPSRQPRSFLFKYQATFFLAQEQLEALMKKPRLRVSGFIPRI